MGGLALQAIGLAQHAQAALFGVAHGAVDGADAVAQVVERGEVQPAVFGMEQRLLDVGLGRDSTRGGPRGESGAAVELFGCGGVGSWVPRRCVMVDSAAPCAGRLAPGLHVQGRKRVQGAGECRVWSSDAAAGRGVTGEEGRALRAPARRATGVPCGRGFRG